MTLTGFPTSSAPYVLLCDSGRIVGFGSSGSSTPPVLKPAQVGLVAYLASSSAGSGCEGSSPSSAGLGAAEKEEEEEQEAAPLPGRQAQHRSHLSPSLAGSTPGHRGVGEEGFIVDLNQVKWRWW
jgi:hypothetical protein